MKISEHLMTGKENATSGKALAYLLGMDLREVTKGIERERRSGIPICASSNGKNPGFYLAANKAEMAAYCQSLFHRAGELHKTRNECLKTIDKLPD